MRADADLTDGCDLGTSGAGVPVDAYSCRALSEQRDARL